MNFVSNEDLRKIINEAVNSVLKEAGAPGGGMAGPIPGGGMAGPRPGGGMAGPRPGGGMAGPKPGGGMAGPRPGGGMAAPKPGGSANNAAASPTDDTQEEEGGKMKDGTYVPKCEYAYYEKWWEPENPTVEKGETPSEDDEVLKIGLNYIYPQHMEPLITKWNANYSDIFTAQKMWNKKKGDTAAYIQIRVKPGKEQDFVNLTKTLYDDIASLSETDGKTIDKKTGNLKITKNKAKYSTNVFEKSRIYLVDLVKKAPSKADMNRIELKAADSWRELLSNMNDPKTLNALSTIGGVVYTTSLNTDKKQGHVLTDRNKIQIISQRPDIAVRAQNGERIFVTQEWVWRKYFNREIVDPSQKMTIIKPTSHKPSNPQAFEKACQNCGYASVDEFKAATKNSQHKRWAVYAEYNKINPADTLFGPVVVYEYANTQLIPGKPDLFNDEEGLADNIYNVPNDASIRANGIQQAPDASQQPAAKTRSDEELEEISNLVADIIHSHTQSSVVRTGNPGDDIAENVYKYGQYLSINIGFAKPEYREAYCQSLAAAVAATLGFPTIKGANYLRKVLSNRGADMELKTMLILFIRKYQELMLEINEEWKSKVSSLRKSGKFANSPTYKKVVEEDGNINAQSADANPIGVLSVNQLSNVLGVPIEKIINDGNTDNEGYENVDPEIKANELQESFFRMLDRIELI